MSELERIRRAEEISHTQAYTEYSLFEPGSWLAKPVKTVLEIMERLQGREGLNVLDLGCGVGRNAIPIARALDAEVDCVDILPFAIGKLQEYAQTYGVNDKIHGIASGIDEYEIKEEQYDLILAVSALEHMDSPFSFVQKLNQIHKGLRPGGILCLIVNSGTTETDATTGEALRPQFEVNIPTEELMRILEEEFANMDTIKKTVVPQAYDIPRENGISHLTSHVVTFAATKPMV